MKYICEGITICFLFIYDKFNLYLVPTPVLSKLLKVEELHKSFKLFARYMTFLLDNYAQVN